MIEAGSTPFYLTVRFYFTGVLFLDKTFSPEKKIPPKKNDFAVMSGLGRVPLIVALVSVPSSFILGSAWS